MKFNKATIAIFAVAAPLLAACSTVGPNEVGVKVVGGKIKDCNVQSGQYFNGPRTDYKKFSTLPFQTNMLRAEGEGDRAGDDSIEVASTEGAKMNADMTITVRFVIDVDNEKAVCTMFKTVKSEDDFREKFLRPATRSVTRNVFTGYAAKDAFTTKRGEIQEKIKTELQKKFDAEKRPVVVESVDLRDIYLPKNIQDRIDQTINAEADAQTAAVNRKKQETEAETLRIVALKTAETSKAKAEGDANAKLAAAEAEAKTKVVNAKADAEAKLLNAEAEARANREISQSMSPELIELRKVQACAEAIGKTGAAIVNCGGTGGSSSGSSGSSGGATIIVDGRK